ANNCHRGLFAPRGRSAVTKFISPSLHDVGFRQFARFNRRVKSIRSPLESILVPTGAPSANVDRVFPANTDAQSDVDSSLRARSAAAVAAELASRLGRKVFA